jgi:hypothetical protein
MTAGINKIGEGKVEFMLPMEFNGRGAAAGAPSFVGGFPWD